jgi:hypothetical protein
MEDDYKIWEVICLDFWCNFLDFVGLFWDFWNIAFVILPYNEVEKKISVILL